MVHVRLNEKESNPNPHINFITPLPIDDPAAEEEARQLLRALAAQVRPVMKAEGLGVNSFEEYQHNQVFAGQNWNNGEVVELVLRNPGGAFLPTAWLLSTLCHELAHVKHMNHGPAFQAYWAKLRNDVRRLQSQGYYGDGYWSSGTRLADSARVSSIGEDAFGLPEYMCGGAQSRARPTGLRRRRRQAAASSNHTGAQTAKRRKAGSRITAQGTFKGAGRALDEDVSDEDQKKAGAGFRKKAASKRAREERALAAERRLLALQGKASTSGAKDESDDDDDDYETAPETDQDRRRVMLDATDKAELDGLKTSNQRFITEFIFPSSESAPSSGSSSKLGKVSSQSNTAKRLEPDVLELFSDNDDDKPPHPTSSGTQSTSKGGTGAATASVVPMGKRKARPASVGTQARTGGQPQDMRAPQPIAEGNKLPYGSLVRDEIRSRKRESLGMNGNGRRLGSVPSKNNPEPQSPLRDATPKVGDLLRPTLRGAGGDAVWACQVCTLMNEAAHLACAACATPRGEAVWSGSSD
ncbi:WLM domain-containing protein [Trametes maxima]|nr:WLM domain-containing protein [Trametes maxima]